MIPFSEVDQALQEHFVKENVPNWSFQLVLDIYWTKKFYILSRYTSVATTITKVVLFECGLPGILLGKYLSFSIVNYLSSSKVEVSKCAPLSLHSQKMHNKLIKRQIKDLSIERSNCI